MSLKTDNLNFFYRKRQVLRDIGFEISSGCLTAVMGANGSGKTTLLKTINRLLNPASGTVLINGCPAAKMSGGEIARNIGYVPQRQDAACCTVFEAVLLGRKSRRENAPVREDLHKVENILRMVRLDHLAMRPASEISGGELQKVIIARALAQEPALLLLDEPINHLDPVNQIEVMSLLHAVTKELDIASLLVTHDLNSALRFADRFILLKSGEILAHGDQTIITPASIKEVFGMDVVIEEVAGTSVVIPDFRETRSHVHYHVHEHGHKGSGNARMHMHQHSHTVDSHIFDHEHFPDKVHSAKEKEKDHNRPAERESPDNAG